MRCDALEATANRTSKRHPRILWTLLLTPRIQCLHFEGMRRESFKWNILAFFLVNMNCWRLLFKCIVYKDIKTYYKCGIDVSNLYLGRNNCYNVCPWLVLVRNHVFLLNMLYFSDVWEIIVYRKVFLWGLKCSGYAFELIWAPDIAICMTCVIFWSRVTYGVWCRLLPLEGLKTRLL